MAGEDEVGDSRKERNNMFSIDVDKLFQEAKLKLPKSSANYVDKHPKMKEFESKIAQELQKVTIHAGDEEGDIEITLTCPLCL